MGAGSELRWYEQHRQEWIAEMLSIYGFINREHIMRKFGVSLPQASTDLGKYERAHQDSVFYNRSSKRYGGLPMTTLLDVIRGQAPPQRIERWARHAAQSGG